MADTLPEFLLHWADRTPDAIFVHEPDRGRAFTYGQIAAAVARFRAQLRRLGVTRGDRVAILAENSAVWVIAYLGAMAHGGVAAPLNTRHAAGDLDRVLKDLDPAAILGDPPYLTRLPPRYPSRVIASDDVGLAVGPAPTLDGTDARPGDVGVLCYTSGTTGAPRGVMIRHGSLVRNAAM